MKRVAEALFLIVWTALPSRAQSAVALPASVTDHLAPQFSAGFPSSADKSFTTYSQDGLANAFNARKLASDAIDPRIFPALVSSLPEPAVPPPAPGFGRYNSETHWELAMALD